ncbi:hypothetical protein ABZV91_14885 [Nocardia sp. NPDC004568]|uniref:hypothetical protein n=1 Tax=Nocardia sp. NPDC004568 TaxID=3154551 RepID=UPI0033AD0A4F
MDVVDVDVVGAQLPGPTSARVSGPVSDLSAPATRAVDPRGAELPPLPDAGG